MTSSTTKTAQERCIRVRSYFQICHIQLVPVEEVQRRRNVYTSVVTISLVQIEEVQSCRDTHTYKCVTFNQSQLKRYRDASLFVLEQSLSVKTQVRRCQKCKYVRTFEGITASQLKGSGVGVEGLSWRSRSCWQEWWRSVQIFSSLTFRSHCSYMAPSILVLGKKIIGTNFVQFSKYYLLPLLIFLFFRIFGFNTHS